jgi:lipoate-protein ligase A
LNEVQIARRFTGGGTVFHDEGTLNLTLVSGPRESLSALRFQENNLKLVAKTLDKLGLSCTTSGNSILIAGRKVCGASAAIGVRFALWHCSILVDSNAQLLELVLAPGKSANKSRFVHSKWQNVMTLAQALARPIRVNEVANSFESTAEVEIRAEPETGQLSEAEEEYAEALYSQKYVSSEWNLNGNRGHGWNAEIVDRITQRLPCASALRP